MVGPNAAGEEASKSASKHVLSFEESPYLSGILVSLIPYVVTLLIIFQYISPARKKSSNNEKKRQHRKYLSLLWLLFRKQVSWSGYKLNCIYFWKELSTRVWIFYVECLYIPKYRKEWGHYSTWHFSPDTFISEVNDPLDPREPEIPLNPDPASINLPVESVIKTKETEEDSSAGATHVKDIIRHDHSQCEIITICVNGLIFQTQKKTLARFPYTLLGNEVLRERFYDPVNRFYFVDRNRAVFDSVLYYYQSGGVLRRPDVIPLHIFMEDMEFYMLDQKSLAKFRDNEYITEEKIPEVPAGLLSRKLWCLFEFSGSSTQARFVAFISFLVVLISLTIFCIDTMPDYNDDFTIIIQSNGEALAMKQVQGGTINFRDPIDILEFSCVAWFCFEILIRYLSCPTSASFFTDTLNITDILSIVPWFVTLGSMIYAMITHANDYPDLQEKSKTTDTFLQLLKATRLIRVLRILKLSRHSSGLQILGKTLMASVSELFMLVFFIVIGVLVFSSVMYFVEYGEPTTPFTSIPLGFWWAVCTMTTVGYGDDVPKGVGGKLIGTVAALAGLLTIALPVPVIVNNFKFFCNQNFNKSEVNLIQTNHVSNCPYRPQGKLFHVDEQNGDSGEEQEYDLLIFEHRHILIKYHERPDAMKLAAKKIERNNRSVKFLSSSKTIHESKE